MKTIITGFFLLLYITCLSQKHSYSDCVDTLQLWLEKRIQNAQNDKNEIIKMPFVVRTLGWGCRCPEHYIGVSTNTHEGPWIAPVAPDNFPKPDTIGYSLIVTGYFTGKIIELDLRNHNGEPDEWLYKIPEFKISDWELNTAGYGVHPPKKIETKIEK